MLRVLQRLLLLREQSEASAGEVGTKGEIKRSDEFPERVLKEEREVEEKDMSYLTIGIVVNAPYGRKNHRGFECVDGDFCHCSDGSLDLIVARAGNCCQTTALLGRYISRTHLQSPLMDYVKAKKVILRYPGENTVNIDGEELTYQEELVVEILESGITCYGEL